MEGIRVFVNFSSIPKFSHSKYLEYMYADESEASHHRR